MPHHHDSARHSKQHSTSSGYGCWVCTPVSYTAQTLEQDPKSPHITLKYSDGSQPDKSAAINVRSTDTDSRLVYWHIADFQHPITTTISNLALGFHPASSDSSGALNLDYIRTQPPLLDFKAGLILSTEVPGPNNDVEDDVKAVLDTVIAQEAQTYIFGESYGTGIHDIHMNQGSGGNFTNEVGQGGALIFQFSDGHWEAIFIAFASQRIPTDDQTGKPLPNSQTLASIIQGSDSS